MAAVTVAEAMSKKRELERTLSQAAYGFEQTTGLTITAIELRRYSSGAHTCVGDKIVDLEGVVCGADLTVEL